LIIYSNLSFILFKFCIFTFNLSFLDSNFNCVLNAVDIIVILDNKAIINGGIVKATIIETVVAVIIDPDIKL
jgi:hypothetical protein